MILMLWTFLSAHCWWELACTVWDCLVQIFRLATVSFWVASGGEAWSTHKLIDARSGRFVSWWSSWFFWLSIWALLVMWLALSVDWWSIWAIAHLSSWALLNLFCSFYTLLTLLTNLCKFWRFFLLLNDLLLTLPELTLEWIIHQWDLRHRLFLSQHLLLIAILI